jgi:hypothetical protein
MTDFAAPDYRQLHKALSTVTDKNPAFLVPILTAVWDLIPTEAMDTVMETAASGDTVDVSAVIRNSEKPEVKNMDDTALVFLGDMLNFRMFAVERAKQAQAALIAKPVPIEELEPVEA